MRALTSTQGLVLSALARGPVPPGPLPCGCADCTALLQLVDDGLVTYNPIAGYRIDRERAARAVRVQLVSLDFTP